MAGFGWAGRGSLESLTPSCLRDEDIRLSEAVHETAPQAGGRQQGNAMVHSVAKVP